jgi:Gp5 C-terminal repeat (3 copies)
MRIRTDPGRRRLVLVAVVVIVLAAGGVAYATIPDANGVYTACRLNATGTIRLIDPSGPSTSLLSHCTSLETQITWNQKGQQGPPGASPTVAQLQAGDSHCVSGGASITDASGNVAYVCSGTDGAPGKDGAPFSGTFTSPNGQYTLTVADGGVSVVGPDSSIRLPAAGGVEITTSGALHTTSNDEVVTVHHDRTETIGDNQSTRVGNDRSELIASNDQLTVKGNRTEHVDANETIEVGGSRSESAGGTSSVNAGLVLLNGGSACRPVARVLDHVNLTTGQITEGSPTVCAGG